MKRGFTLVELMVVVGIIAILMGIGGATYSRFVKKAQAARGTELVHSVQTALVAVLQNEDAWPRAVLAEGKSGEGEMTALVGGALAKRGVLTLTYKKTTDPNTEETVYKLTGIDQFGVVTPWASDVIKKKLATGSVSESTKVPSGGTIRDHRLRFAVDDDYDGYTQVKTSARGNGSGAKVRASACVWCCGQDGEFNTEDDIFSWTAAQEVK